MHICTSWGVLGCPRVSWGIKTDRSQNARKPKRPRFGQNVPDQESLDLHEMAKHE